MAAILTNGVPAAISSILLPLPLARSNYAGAAPRSPDLLPTALPRGSARLHICSIVNGLARSERRHISHAAARAGPPRPAFPAFLAGAGQPARGTQVTQKGVRTVFRREQRIEPPVAIDQ